jgi:thiamine-phosphate diphosphorylase
MRLQAALESGARIVQFRSKRPERRAFLEQARSVQALCRKYDSLFIVNDAADVAALLEADGLHLGQDDLPPELARELVGDDMLIGLSVSTLPEAESAGHAAAVDYLGVGAMFETPTKPEAEYGGLELLRAVRSRVDLPLVAIGGITLDRVDSVWAAGADLVAVVSAVFAAADPATAVRAFLSGSP